MIIRLFCPKCTFKAAKEKREKGSPRIIIDMPMPMSHLADDGRYEVRCAAGHVCAVFVDNLKFELLFEMGLNALIDGNTRDAVFSFASSLERFYEFYWHVTAAFQSVPLGEVAATWKVAAQQSERQLGMFITARLIMTKKFPELLDQNKEVKLRNDVIHKGYVPTAEEAIAFGDVVMRLINNDLADMRILAPEALIATYDLLSPAPKDKKKQSGASWNGDEEHRGVVNILTAVDVRYPPTAGNDSRRGGVEEQFARVLRDREPHRLTLFDEAELKAHLAKKQPPRTTE